MGCEPFHSLYSRYRSLIYRRCRQLLRNTADAEDATQEVLLRVASRLGRAPPPSNEQGWIYSVVTNHCLNELRANRRRAGRLGALADELDESSHWGGEHPATNRDAAKRLAENLPDHLTRAAWLRYVAEMSPSEVGERLGCSRRTVFVYLNLFKTQARHVLGRDT
jgi:RNA polymerase sigma-70 factor (ECF subfamily)